jgi:hypothetical protein
MSRKESKKPFRIGFLWISRVNSAETGAGSDDQN